MEYFPETGYTLIGSGALITSILRHYDRQLIFTADAAYYSYLEYLTGTSDSLIAAFPVLPLSDERGNVPSGQALLVENDPFTLTEAGLCRWISTNVRDERNAVLVSSAISAALQREDTERARMFHRKRTSELYLWFDTVLYAYHCGLNLFYRYEIPSILGFCQGKEELYFFTAEGIFRVGGNTDDGKEIRARWVSRILPFGSLSRYKRLYRTTVYLEGEEGGSVQILLKKDDASEKTTLSFSPADTVTARSFRTRLGRFCYLQIALETEGNTPLHCFGLELQGRETDLIRKE